MLMSLKFESNVWRHQSNMSIVSNEFHATSIINSRAAFSLVRATLNHMIAVASWEGICTDRALCEQSFFTFYFDLYMPKVHKNN